MEKIYRLIKLNRLIRNHRVKFFFALLAHHLKMRHLFLRLDPVMACNLRCTMCYFSDESYRQSAKGMFRKGEIERIAKLLFPRTIQLVIGCGTEPTLYKEFTEIIRLGKSYGVPYIGFTTNGQLLTEEHLESFIRYGLDELALSVHGVTKETYERFMVNASYERFHGLLEKLTSLKKTAGGRKPAIRLNYTVNAENLDELSAFFNAFGSYDIKTIQIRPVMDIGGKYRSLLQPREIGKYEAIVDDLRRESRDRKITFMANTADPSYQTANFDSLILQAVKRYISPEVVWRTDFRWREETYDEFCRRIKWSRYVWNSMFTDKETLAERSTSFSGKYAARYEVIV